MNEWLLITHIFALFPIGMFIFSYKTRYDPESIFILIKFIFCVTFSFIYHSYDIENSVLDKSVESIWTLLDGYASTTLIFTATLYSLRVRSPNIYIISSFFEPFVLAIYLMKSLSYLIIWTLLVSCFIIIIIQWKTLYRYLTKYIIISILLISCIITSAITFFIAYSNGLNNEYITFHSLWHFFVFISAGMGALLRFKLNEMLYPVIRREQVDSI